MRVSLFRSTRPHPIPPIQSPKQSLRVPNIVLFHLFSNVFEPCQVSSAVLWRFLRYVWFSPWSLSYSPTDLPCSQMQRRNSLRFYRLPENLLHNRNGLEMSKDIILKKYCTNSWDLCNKIIKKNPTWTLMTDERSSKTRNVQSIEFHIRCQILLFKSRSGWNCRSKNK